MKDAFRWSGRAVDSRRASVGRMTARICAALLLVLTLPPLALLGRGEDEKAERCIRLTVRGPSGKPLPHAWVTYNVEGPKTNVSRWVVADEPVPPMNLRATENPPTRIIPKSTEMTDGKARFCVPSEVTKVWVEVHHAKGSVSGEPDPAATVIGPLDVAGRTDVEVKATLEPGRIVRGSLGLDAGTSAPHGACVLAIPVRPHYARGFPGYCGVCHAEAEIEADGSYLLTGLGKYDYVVRFEVPEPWAVPDSVLVRHGKVADAEIRLPPAQLVRAVTGRVVVKDMQGAPVARARVRIYYAGPAGFLRDVRLGGMEMDALMLFETGPDGVARVSGLHPDRLYTVRVTAPNGREDFEPYRRFEEWSATSEIPLTLRSQGK